MTAIENIPQGIPEKPTPLQVMPDNIPRPLQLLDQWTGWKYELKGTKWTKPPYQPNGNRASSTNSATWSDFSDIVAAYEEGTFDGIGFVFSQNDGFAGIDLDHCIDGEGRPINGAGEIVSNVDSYTEISPSGDGLHIIVLVDIPTSVKNGAVELYNQGRYFTFS